MFLPSSRVLLLNHLDEKLEILFFSIVYLPVSFGWLPKIIQYFYLNLPGFFLLFFFWKNEEQLSSIFHIIFRWLPTSYCLTPENPVSSLQVADAVRYVHAQKMVHRAAGMITCICLRCFLQQYHGKTPSAHHLGKYVLPFSKHQPRKSKIMFFSGFCMSTCIF